MVAKTGKHTTRTVGVITITAVVASLSTAIAQAAPSTVNTTAPPKSPVAVGHDGAVSSVDADATAIGVSVLREGGNAVDAAVATAAALGVTDPFSSGIGGGGFMVVYDARTGEVHTIDGRETAPASADENLFVENGKAIPFDQAVTSGLSVGTPGTVATWRDALRSWGTRPLAKVLKPAEALADKGFTVDGIFRSQISKNAKRFAAFPATKSLYLPNGAPPAVGSTFRNPDLAATYRSLAASGTDFFYRGPLAGEIVRTAQNPPVDQSTGLMVRPGKLAESDLARYRTVPRQPTKTSYRGLDVYGMPAPSSGGITVGEALNMLENYDVGALSKVDYLHYFLEASRLSFADRNRWIGDPRFVDVPSKELLSQRFADSRACLINKDKALSSPVASGDPRRPASCDAGGTPAATPYEGKDTTHLTVADRWGNVVAYTLTIEQEGGSGIVVPGRGFLLNNELTDFSLTPTTPGVPDPNLPGPGKRPRSSMAPTIVLDDGKPLLAVGSPGGATIITTVLQVLLGKIDRGMSLVDAISAPRVSQRNAKDADVEQQFLTQQETTELRNRGQGFAEAPAEIGAATAIEVLPDGHYLAAAEPLRRGGGAAAVVHPK